MLPLPKVNSPKPPKIIRVAGKCQPDHGEDQFRRLIIERLTWNRSGLEGGGGDFAKWNPPKPGISLDDLPVWKAAAERITAAIDAQQKIIIFGDYDCDGVCSVVLMMDYLESAGLATENITPFVPNRFEDSYGLSEAALEKALRLREQTDLLVAVDCGSPSLDALAFLRQKGIDTIVIDHHKVPAMGKDHPADFHLNPKGWPELKNRLELCELCAAGLVYLFCDAMARENGNRKWNSDRGMILAGLATCADVVPIFRLNRAMVKHAIQLCRNLTDRYGKLPGLWALHKEMNKEFHEEYLYYPTIDEWTFGFEWGPCINANGRLDEARRSFDLLRATDLETAAQLADECAFMNRRRMGIQRRVWEQAREQARAQVGNRPPVKVILCAGKAWNIGVVGIVAARLREEFCRPAIVCGQDAEGNWRGSGRSVPGFSLGDCFIAAQGKTLLNGGGHDMAGGLRMTEQQRPDFHRWINGECKMKEEEFVRVEEIVAEADELSAKGWATLLEDLRPFGQKHPKIPIMLQHAWLDTFCITTLNPPVPNAVDAVSVQTPVKSDAESKTAPADPPKPFRFAEAGFLLPGKPDAPFHVSWKDIERVKKEWRKGRRYTLELNVRASKKGNYYFSVVDCWLEANDPLPPPVKPQIYEQGTLDRLKEMGFWPKNSPW